MTDSLHLADGLNTMLAVTTAAIAAIQQALAQSLIYPHWSAQLTEAGIARQQAARLADPPVVDGDTVYRLMRLDATEGHGE